MTNKRYYWRMRRGGELIGPTIDSHASIEKAKEEIKRIMAVDILPDDFVIEEQEFSSWSNKNPVAERQKEESKKSRKKSIEFMKDVLKDIPYGFSIVGSSIKPEIGSYIDLKVRYHTVIGPGYCDGKEFNLDNQDQREKFVKYIAQKLRDRIRRGKKSKKIESRTESIGKYEHVTEKTIEKADFEVYLDPDQEITEADVYIIGRVKFYKKSWRNVMFDIDDRKILTRDGKKEIESNNTDLVINKLLECLAGKKMGNNT